MFESVAALAAKTKQRILVIDIETAPHMAHVWGLWDQNIHPLNGQLIEPGRILCFAAAWHGEKKRPMFFSERDEDGGRATMLAEAWRLLDEADVVVTYNGKQFDIKHLNTAFIEAGMTPPSPYKQVDLLTVVRTFKWPSAKLDYVARRLLNTKKTAHTGFQLWLDVMAGDDKAWRLMKRYNVQDVVITSALYDRLRPWVRNHPHAGLHSLAADACTNCGNAGPHEYTGLHRTAATVYDRYRCKCGTHLRGNRPLLDPRLVRQAA